MDREAKRVICRTSMLNDDGLAACCFLGIFMTQKLLGSLSEVSRDLRWSETKNLKISIPDNIFLLSLIIIKLWTLKQLENVHQKLKLKFL